MSDCVTGISEKTQWPVWVITLNKELYQTLQYFFIQALQTNMGNCATRYKSVASNIFSFLIKFLSKVCSGHLGNLKRANLKIFNYLLYQLFTKVLFGLGNTTKWEIKSGLQILLLYLETVHYSGHLGFWANSNNGI